jgi:hypothetical protein
MRTILRRIGLLEDRYAAHLSDTPKVAVRLRISYPWKGALDLAKSRCTRMLTAVGTVIETVWLEGDADGISDEELERLIASFPITGERTR